MSGWQIAGTMASSCATVVAIVVVIINIVQRRNDVHRIEDSEAKAHLAQARLVVVRGDGVGYRCLGHDGGLGICVFSVQNSGDRSIVDATLEIWTMASSLDEPAPFSVVEKVIIPGEVVTTLEIPTTLNTANLVARAWRFRWTDADGLHWCRENTADGEPVEFSGASPRPAEVTSPAPL